MKALVERTQWGISQPTHRVRVSAHARLHLTLHVDYR